MTADLFPRPDHDPGGRGHAVPPSVDVRAVFGGPDRRYRYWLRWSWDRSLGTLAVGMMNPSVADERTADRTVLWVWRWAVRNGFGSFIVVNSAAYRCTNQSRLAEVDDPWGPENTMHITSAALNSDLFVLAYGKPRVPAIQPLGPRMARIAAMHRSAGVHVWGLTLDGVPRHPLYLLGDVAAVPFSVSLGRDAAIAGSGDRSD